MLCYSFITHLMARNNSVNQTECHVTPPRQVCSTYADVHLDLECLPVLGKDLYNTWREKYPLAFLFISMAVAMRCKNVLEHVLEGNLCDQYLALKRHKYIHICCFDVAYIFLFPFFTYIYIYIYFFFFFFFFYCKVFMELKLTLFTLRWTINQCACKFIHWKYMFVLVIFNKNRNICFRSRMAFLLWWRQFDSLGIGLGRICLTWPLQPLFGYTWEMERRNNEINNPLQYSISVGNSVILYYILYYIIHPFCIAILYFFKYYYSCRNHCVM